MANILGSGKDFNLVEDGYYFVTLNPQGKRISVMYNKGLKFVKIYDDKFVLERNGKILDFDKYCKIMGALKRGTDKFDGDFAKIAIYQRYLQLMPFVGVNYSLYKLLIIAESHYLPDNCDPAVVFHNWYNSSSLSLANEPYIWTNTSLLTNNNWIDGDVLNIYRNPAFAVAEACGQTNLSGIEKLDYFLKGITYMNFFQRPAEKQGKSINETKQDVDTANQTLKEVIKVIKPEYICFLSAKAWYYFDKSLFDPSRTSFTAHPTCRWWNKASIKYPKPEGTERISGRESFKYFIKKNHLF